MNFGISVTVVGIAIGLIGCQRTPQRLAGAVPQPEQTLPTARPRQSPKPLSEIDLTKIGPLAPKGRVQDKDYNESQVVDDLISNGRDAIPFLISKLDDRTVINYSVEDYWPRLRVGDLAFLILSDFSLDSTWTRETIPGTGWDEIFEATSDPNEPGSNYYYKQTRKHGRGWVKAKWEKIWATYKDRIVWDEKERCFKVA